MEQTIFGDTAVLDNSWDQCTEAQKSDDKSWGADTPNGQETAQPSELFNIICGVKIDKNRAEHLLRYWQYMHGQMSMSLQLIDEFNLTKPIPVDESNEFAGRGEDFENGRIRSLIASSWFDPKLRGIIMAKQTIGQGHIALHESFILEYVRVPRSVGASLWTQAFDSLYDKVWFNFRNIRNVFAHSFLRTDYGNDLRTYREVKELYSDYLPVLNILIAKLQAGLADKYSWNVDKSCLSFDDRPDYALDCPAAEAQMEEHRNSTSSGTDSVSSSTEKLSVPPTWDSQNGWDLPVAQDVPLPDSSIDLMIAWLSETKEDWEPNYRIERRQSWSHFYGSTDARCWM